MIRVVGVLCLGTGQAVVSVCTHFGVTVWSGLAGLRIDGGIFPLLVGVWFRRILGRRLGMGPESKFVDVVCFIGGVFCVRVFVKYVWGL